jgi:hypothetical protein
MSAPVEALALAEMEEIKAAQQAPERELLPREMAAFDVRASRAGNYAEKQGRDQRRAVAALVDDSRLASSVRATFQRPTQCSGSSALITGGLPLAEYPSRPHPRPLLAWRSGRDQATPQLT